MRGEITEEEKQARLAAKNVLKKIFSEIYQPGWSKPFPIKEGGFAFGSDPEFPGMIVQLHWDGRKVPGRLKDGRFVPTAFSPRSTK